MAGINQDELEGILGRVFAKHSIPFELRDVVWGLLDLVDCIGCDQLFHGDSLHKCAVYGNDSCDRCVKTHFCISLEEESQTLNDFLRYELSRISYVQCHTDASHKYCVVAGFGEVHADAISEALGRLKDGSGMMSTIPSRYGMQGMTFEYIQGQKKRSSLSEISYIRLLEIDCR
jgi:hypothetical protein